MGKVKIPIMECKKCGHKWYLRTPDPEACPKCKSHHYRDPNPSRRGAPIRKI